MKTAVLIKVGEIAGLERPVCAPAQGEAQIGVKYVALCGSDLALFDGRLPSRVPIVLGHEFSGRITALGDGVTGLAIGQSVSIAPLLACGACLLCLSGLGYLYPKRRIFGVDVNGAMQDYVCMPADCIFSLPPHVSLLEGALVEPLAVAVHVVHQAGDIEGANALVLGAGAIGLLIAQVARAYGAGNVVILDRDAERLHYADKLGLTVVDTNLDDPVAFVQARTDGRGVDILFEATGSPAVARYFFPVLALRGSVVIVGRMEQPVTLDLGAMLLKEARLLTSRYFTLADFQRAMNLLAAGSVSVAPLIQKVMPFNRLSERDGTTVMDAARQVVRLLLEL